MKIIDRYILKKFLLTFAFVVLILVSVVLILTFSNRNETFIKNNISPRLIAEYFLAFAPYVANLLMPITVFIATVFVTSQMAARTEIVAILSGGISYPRMLRPFVLGAIIIGVFSFFMTGWIIPNANKFRVAFEQLYFQQEYNFSGRDVHFKVSPTKYVYLSSYDNKNDIGYRFTLEEIQEGEVEWKLGARKITWDSVERGWQLNEWNYREFDDLEENYVFNNREDTLIKINMSPDDFGNLSSFEQTLTISELDQYISELEMKGADNIAIYEIEKLTRFMSPFTALILTFMGVTLSSRKTRGGVGFQIAMGFLLAFIYIIMFIAAKSNAETGSMNTVLTIWFPNIVFTAVGLLIYRFVPK